MSGLGPIDIQESQIACCLLHRTPCFVGMVSEMAVKRYELNDAQWSKIAAVVPGKATDPGRTVLDSRLFVNGCLRVLPFRRALARSA